MTARCVLLALLLAACEEDETCLDPHDFDRAASYSALATQVQYASKGSYSFAITNMTADTCGAAHARYDQQVRPRIDDMGALAADVDALIAMHDPASPNHGDAVCLQAALLAELDAHAAAACMGATVEESRAEAQRHIDAVVMRTDQVIGRMNELIAAIDRAEEEDCKGPVDWTWTLPRACP